MVYHISRAELLQAQAALIVAIILQFVVTRISADTVPGSHNVIIFIELALVILLSLTVNMHSSRSRGLHHLLAVVLLGLLSAANISALAVVLHSLIIMHATTGGEQLLASAVAIFVTNIIVYALWYWEIDSPGLTRTTWSKYDKDFQFTQQDMPDEFLHWHPEFGDYLFVSVTNAVNFAPADTRPLSRQAKFLMASQSLVSVFTLALVIARSVSILN